MVYTDKIHLIADTLEELHNFADSIGLKREYFQDHKRHPHYDIWGIMLSRAIEKGAIIVTSKNLIKCYEKY